MSNNYVLLPNGNTIAEDELYHWKYIKREKVGGKWRYYYKDDDLEKAKVGYETADAKAKDYAQSIAEREKTIKAMDDIIGGKVPNKTVYKDGVVSTQHYSKEAAKAIKSVSGMNLEFDKKYSEYLRNEASNAKTTYDTMNALYKDSFGYKVADFLNDSTDAISKAKDWLDMGKEERHELSRAEGRVENTAIDLARRKKAYYDLKSKVDDGIYFDKDRGNKSIYEAEEKAYQQAKEAHKIAKRRAEKAKKAYESTPLFKMTVASKKIEKNAKRVFNWFKEHGL